MPCEQALLSRPPPGPLDTKLQPLSPELEEWFAKRGISQDTLQRNGVAMEVRWCPAAERELPHIAFPYTKNGATVNIKYRALEKYFTQTKGGEQLFYGYDDAKVRLAGFNRLSCCSSAVHCRCLYVFMLLAAYCLTIKNVGC